MGSSRIERLSELRASRPSPRQIANLCDQIRNLSVRRKGVVPIDSISERLAAAVHRERAGTTVPDSYPTETLLDGEGRGRHPGSPTARAAVARADGDVERDLHRVLTTEALECLLLACEALRDLTHRLDALDALQATSGPLRRTCEVCTGKRPLTGDQQIYRRSTVHDRLILAADLCRRCHYFVESESEPGQRDGRVPTDDEIRFNDEHGYWRIRQPLNA